MATLSCVCARATATSGQQQGPSISVDYWCWSPIVGTSTSEKISLVGMQGSPGCSLPIVGTVHYQQLDLPLQMRLDNYSLGRCRWCRVHLHLMPVSGYVSSTEDLEVWANDVRGHAYSRWDDMGPICYESAIGFKRRAAKVRVYLGLCNSSLSVCKLATSRSDWHVDVCY